MIEEIGTHSMKDTQTQMREDSQRATLALLILVLVALCTASRSNAQEVRKVTSKAKDDATSKMESVKTVHADNSSSAENERTPDSALDVSTKPTIDGGVPHQTPSPEPQKQSSKPEWHCGGFVDAGYLLDFNHPANRLFRSRGTTWHVDRLHLNMAGFYLRKKASEESPWGVELTAQAGKDTEVFGFSATAPNIGGFKYLRHLGPTNASYFAPVGKGLTLQGGIFSSLIGYDSLYAKDNFEYTRPWGADFTPYFMMGVNASYPFNKKLTGTFFVVNGYWHLAHANNVPSWGGQLAYAANSRVTLKETVMFGPHQTDTSFKFWRSLSDTIVERKTDRITFAFEYIYSSENVVAPGNPRALMMSAQLPIHWTINKRWSATVRPEVFWDRDGRWTLARQTVKALTSTLEYRIPYKWSNTIFRLEHRYDDSRGPDGGFFRGAELRPGVVGLTPTQHLLIFGLIFTFDRKADSGRSQESPTMPTHQRETIPSISSRDTTSTKRVVMSVASQKDWTAPDSWEEVKRNWMNFAKDLKAFTSLQIAWFIVARAKAGRPRDHGAASGVRTHDR